jgi:PTS system galactitol-specific IIC component
VLPVIIFILALILGQRPGRAFRSGITVGVGFVGIGLLVGLLIGQLAPAAQAMVSRFHFPLNIIDVGWPSTAAIAFGSKVGALAIPIGLAVNIVFLAIGLSKTLDIDIWNYWHIAFIGAIVAVISNSFPMGLVAAAIDMGLLLALADWSAPWVQEYYKIPNISLPHGTSAPYVFFALPFNWIFDRIPGLRDVKADTETIERRLGVFGESVILGLLLGLIIGAFAYFNAADIPASIKSIATLGISMAAVMLILPRMVAILMEGLVPVSEAAGEFVRKRFPGRDFYIGLDSAIAIGAPATIAASLVLVPIVLLIAVILPGNHVLPFGDLGTIPFIVCMMVPIFRGNVFRTVVTGAIAIGTGLWIATWISGPFTTAAHQVGFKFPSGTASISSLVDGSNPVTLIFGLAGMAGWIGMAVVAVLVLAFAWWVRGLRGGSIKPVQEERKKVRVA